MLNFKQIIFIIGIFLAILTGFMLVPMAFALFYAEETIGDFMISGLFTGFIAILCIQSGRHHHFNLNIRDMFMLTSVTWFVVSLFAALPFTLYHGINYTDAFFETMSGITTTGSTVLSGLDNMDHSILVWRSLLQWLGGIGFIVMAVAILPFLNVGGMRLFRTESSDWSDKTIPRTQHMAKHLFLIYAALTMLCAYSYHLAGMHWFEAINHAMTTLSTGGYSTSDKSMAIFSHSAHWVSIVFMLAGGLPLLMFVQTIQQRSLRLWNDQQVKGFLRFVLLVSFSLALATPANRLFRCIKISQLQCHFGYHYHRLWVNGLSILGGFRQCDISISNVYWQLFWLNIWWDKNISFPNRILNYASTN
jgi:trk system potassium uptake protein TrkH